MSTGKAVQFHGSRDCFQPYFHRCSDLAISPGHARQVTPDCQRTPDALGKGRRSGKIRPMRRTARLLDVPGFRADSERVTVGDNARKASGRGLDAGAAARSARARSNAAAQRDKGVAY
jgi:hypothetical protein